MIVFKQEMDPHSLTLERDGKRIGFLHWHPDATPRVKLSGADELSVKELEQIVGRYNLERQAQVARAAAAAEQARLRPGRELARKVLLYMGEDHEAALMTLAEDGSTREELVAAARAVVGEDS